MSHRWRRPRRIRKPPPVRGCRECGAPVRSWREHPLCRTCTRALAVPEGESFRATARRLAGRCAVCGGPYPDGSGCEFCPRPDEPVIACHVDESAGVDARGGEA